MSCTENIGVNLQLTVGGSCVINVAKSKGLNIEHKETLCQEYIL
jgi:hypothetical protein